MNSIAISENWISSTTGRVHYPARLVSLSSVSISEIHVILNTMLRENIISFNEYSID